MSLVILLLAASLAAVARAEPPSSASLEPFNVKDCTGPAAGKTLCYYCRYELRPVVCVFARRIDDDLGELVAAIDSAVARHREQRLAAFVVYLGDDTVDAERSLRQLAAEHKIKHTPLTIYRDTAERLATGLGVSPQTALTIRMWREGEIVAEETHDSARLDGSTDRLVESLARLAASPNAKE